MEKSKHAEDEIAYIGMFSDIDNTTAGELAELVATQLPEVTKTLYFLISTSGGSVSDGFVIYNFLRALPYRIIMHNIGSVDSIGNVIFLAGEERYASPNATFLIHRVKSHAHEERLDTGFLREKLSAVKADEKKVKDIMMERSSLSSGELDSLFQSGVVEDARFALEKGLIHEILDLKLERPDRLFVVRK